MSNQELSISLVIYRTNLNSFESVLHSLNAAAEKFNLELDKKILIYFIDNSEDEFYHRSLISLLDEYYRQPSSISIKIIKNRNIGYGGANNIGILNSPAIYHLVMNPDVYLTEDALIEAWKYLENNPTVGLLTPAIFSMEGMRVYSCRRYPSIFILFLRRFIPGFLSKWTEKVLAHHEMRDQDYNNIIENVPFPSGCFMFLRNEIAKKVGGFDERYFMYFEDLDLARKISQYAAVHYVPRVKIKHQWARGSYKNLKLLRIHAGSACKYFWKWKHL